MLKETELKNEIVADGDVDAAELDREIIASRLRQDVMEHSGKLHKFVAESVSTTRGPCLCHELTSFPASRSR